jgi:hypothetical protein
MDDWPLIRFLLADEGYRAEYVDELRTALYGPRDGSAPGAFDAGAVVDLMSQYHDLIAPYVANEEYPYLASERCLDDGAFETALTELQSHATDRIDAVEAAVGPWE